MGDLSKWYLPPSKIEEAGKEWTDINSDDGKREGMARIYEGDKASETYRVAESLKKWLLRTDDEALIQQVGRTTLAIILTTESVKTTTAIDRTIATILDHEFRSNK